MENLYLTGDGRLAYVVSNSSEPTGAHREHRGMGTNGFPKTMPADLFGKETIVCACDRESAPEYTS